jgi:hypothetical protein
MMPSVVERGTGNVLKRVRNVPNRRFIVTCGTPIGVVGRVLSNRQGIGSCFSTHSRRGIVVYARGPVTERAVFPIHSTVTCRVVAGNSRRAAVEIDTVAVGTIQVVLVPLLVGQKVVAAVVIRTTIRRCPAGQVVVVGDFNSTVDV